jgi:flavin reductase (DIM6/NTAB) family NADH-FMN oxidoreductase RutF
MSDPHPYEDFVQMDPADPALGRRDVYFLLNSLVVPRPIGWISTVSADGHTNLAPHSFSNICCVDPPMVLFTALTLKDTVRNVLDTGCFVYNVANDDLLHEMNLSSVDAPADVSEFELGALETAPSDLVAAPRVARAPAAFECDLEQVVELGTAPSYTVIGRVVRIHVSRHVMDVRGRVDPARLDAIARMGGNVYATTRDRFSLDRPSWRDMSENVSAAAVAARVGSAASPTPKGGTPDD